MRALLPVGEGRLHAAGLDARERLAPQPAVAPDVVPAELVAADDLMPQILWTRYFIKVQGFQMLENTIQQDNQSAMKV